MRSLALTLALLTLAGCGYRVEAIANGARTADYPPCFFTTMPDGIAAAKAACESYGAHVDAVDAEEREVRASTEDGGTKVWVKLTPDSLKGWVDFEIAVTGTMPWDDKVRAVRAIADNIGRQLRSR